MLGSLEIGMSKKAVMLAYGIPPAKETFSTDSQVWTYWTSRTAKNKILFDDDN